MQLIVKLLTCNPSVTSRKHSNCFPINSVLYVSSLIIVHSSGEIIKLFVAPIDFTKQDNRPWEPGIGMFSLNPISSKLITTVPVINVFVCRVLTCGIIWYDMINQSTIWYDIIWYNMIWYDMIWYYVIKYDVI